VAAGKDLDTAGLQKFHDLFIQLGKDLPVSTSDVEQAAIELVKGGIDPATVAAGGLKQAIQFAAAAMKGDLVGAAEISSKIVAGWAEVGATAAEKADLLTHATDQLTKAANASQVDVNGLALGLFNVQGTAKAAGIGFDDVTTVLGELAGDFSSAATAGTSLNAFINRLQPTTADATAKMEELGLMSTSTSKLMKFLGAQGIKPLGTDLDTLGNQFTEFAVSQGMTAKETDKLWQSFASSKFYDDATGKFIGFQASSQLLQDSLAGLTDAQRVQALQTIFQTDAMGVASGLASRGAAGYDAMAAAMGNAMGVQEAAAIQQDSYNTAVKNAGGSIEAMQIALGERLLPVLTDVMNNAIIPAINTLGLFSDAIFGNDEAFAKLDPTMQGIVSTISILVADTQEIVGAFNEAGAGTTDFAQRIGELASDLGLPGQFIAQVVSAVQDMVAAFEDGDSVLNTIIGNWQSEFATIGVYIPGILNSIADITGSVLGQVSAFWEANGADVMATVNGAMKTVGDIYTTVLQIVLTLVGNKLEQMSATFRTHGAQIQQIMTGAWDIVSGVVKGALALIQGAVHVTLDLINGDWGKAWTDIQAMSVTVVTSLQQVIGGALNSIAALFGTSLDKIGALWQHNWDTMVEIAMKVGAKMVAAGDGIVSGIKQGIKDNWSSFTHWVIGLLDGLKDDILSYWGIQSPSTVMADSVGAPLIQGIAAGMERALPAMYGVVDMMGAALKDKFKKITEQQSDQVEQMVEDLQGKLGGIQGMLTGLQGAGFMSTANIDRQKAANLSAMDELNAHAKGIAQQQLADAAKIAATLNDPQQQAEYFEARSKAILEMASLQDTLDRQLSGQQRADLEQTVASIKDRMDETTNDIERQSLQQLLNRDQSMLDVPQLTASQISTLQQQIALINSAQINEGQAQTLDMSQGSQTSDLQKALQDFFAQAGSAQWKDTFPGLMENDNVRALSGMLDRLMAAQVQPASAAQFAASGTASQYNIGQQGNTYNMPIYTNNSPGALQQSFAVMQAGLP
jgi:hypothetical protein